MTILEENSTPQRSKLRLSITNRLKRKGSDPEVPSKKRPDSDTMLNGFRSERGNGDSFDSPVATLSNMGNTCYLNSVLYTLRYAPTFLHNLHHLIGDLALVSGRLSQTKAKTSSLGRNVGAITGPSSRSTSSKDLLSLSSDVIPKSKVQIVTEKLHEVYITMHNLEVKESSDAYQPVALLQAIREANYIFEGNHQQDAHELLVYLLDNLRETCDLLMQQVQQNPDLLTETEILPSQNSSKFFNVRRSWKKAHKKKDKNKESISEEQTNGASVTDTEDSCSLENGSDGVKKKLAYNFVAEDFEGITLRRTMCLECESVTERKEPFYDIPVPISVKDNEFGGEISVKLASDIYRKACVTSEKLCDANKYLCEKCQRYNEASRDVLFEKLPNIMVLQLKRFTTSSAGVQKVTTYLPTPLEMACFCETCCQASVDGDPLPHRYRLCCVIMHLGASMASGHYIAYAKASDHPEDYAECIRNAPKGSLSAGGSEKALNFLKYFKPRTIQTNSLSDTRSIFAKPTTNGVRMCKSMDCCGVKINRNVVENVVNSYPRKADQEDMWLECDDESVQPISSQELKEKLAYKPSSTSTPYLLFYSKINDVSID